MTATTATLVHSSSREADATLTAHRIAAAARVARDRKAAEARREARISRARASALAWIEDVRALGAVTIGVKVCTDNAKYRLRLDATPAAAYSLVTYEDGEYVEAWAVNAAGEYVGEPW